MPHPPHPKQAAFLLHDHVEECLYGGAAGGGKTDALLMGALQYVDTPGYAALLLMKTFPDLALPNAGMSRAREWLGGGAARPVDGGRAWHFPSGASLTFGYLDHLGDEQRYRTAEFQYVAFDELTRFPEQPYRFLFSRLRKPAAGPLADVPLRMRAATNPGGKYGEWVKERFIPAEYHREKGDDRFGRLWWKGESLFVPARRSDNPTLNQDEYGRMLSRLLPVERAQQDDGDWTAHAGGHFREEWLRAYDEFEDSYLVAHTHEVALKRDCLVCAAVDPAGGVSDSADYTAIVVCAITPGGSLLVLEVLRERVGVEGVVPLLAEACLRRRPAWVVMEAAFAQSAYVREARKAGIPNVHPIDPGGQSKLVRATPMILRGKDGMVCLPRRREGLHWVEPFTSELCAFTGDDTMDAYDDQVDALAYVVLALDRFGLGATDDGPAVYARRGQ